MSYVQNTPLFLLYNCLDLLHILNIPLDLFGTLMLILSFYSSWYTVFLRSAQRLTQLLHVVYPAMTTRWSVTHQGQCEERSRMPHNPPSLPPCMAPVLFCFRDPSTSHIPRTLPPSFCIPSKFIFYLKLIQISLNPWHLQGSILRWDSASSITLSSCQILGCLLDLCASEISVHTHLTHSVLSSLRTEVMSDKPRNPQHLTQTLTHHREAGEQSA